MLECFDEQANSLYSGALGVGEALSDLPLGDLADLASGLSGFLSAAGLTPDISIDIEDISYASDKESCVVYVELTMEYMGEKEKEEIALPMVLTGREWLHQYIRAGEFQLTQLKFTANFTGSSAQTPERCILRNKVPCQEEAEKSSCPGTLRGFRAQETR